MKTNSKLFVSILFLSIFISWAASCPVFVTVSGYENWSYCSAPFPCVTVPSPANSFCAQQTGFSLKVANAGTQCSSKCYSSDSIEISAYGTVTFYGSSYEPAQMSLISDQGDCQKFSATNNLMVLVCTNTTA